MSIWSRLVGQQRVVEQLQAAVATAHLFQDANPNAMTHAWLFTGPPGAGRSTAAILFAAALVCEAGGCGTCATCEAVLMDRHPDVERFIPQQIMITRDEAENLMSIASLMPARSKYRVIVVEDADRLNDVSGNMLLKSIEEPAESVVWILCTPSMDDVLATIRSRTRTITLATPTWEEVRDLLIAEGINQTIAAFAAKASAGHIGKARGLATSEASRLRRKEILSIPRQLGDLGSCFKSAKEIVERATEEANLEMDALDETEKDALMQSFGATLGGRGKAERAARPALKDLEGRQKSRRTRAVRDRLDQALVDLMTYYRDVLLIQMVGDGAELINEELKHEIVETAQSSTASKTRVRLEAIEKARRQFASNAQPLMILETLTIELARA